MKYKNATDVLPRSLILEIQKHYYGGAIWIPVPDGYMSERCKTQRERDDLIVKLHQNKTPAKEIARLAQVTDVRVRQIIKRAKSHQNMS